MGAFLDKPKTELETDEGEGNGLKYAMAAMQGWRVSMEDAHCATTTVPHLDDTSFFAVFDGHGGSTVSKIAGTTLLPCIIQALKDRPDKSDESISKAVHKGMFVLDEKMRKSHPDLVGGGDTSGSTAVVGFVTPSSIIIGNCGDSRAIMVSGGSVRFGSIDHKPTDDKERARILAANGTVEMGRVCGNLAVSRSLGDFNYKGQKLPAEKQQVSAEPDMTILPRQEDDQFLVLACDGIWDVMSNDDVAGFVSQSLRAGLEPLTICSNMLTHCLNLNSKDNMTFELITFPNAPTKVEGAAPPTIADAANPSSGLPMGLASSGGDDDDDGEKQDVLQHLVKTLARAEQQGNDDDDDDTMKDEDGTTDDSEPPKKHRSSGVEFETSDQ